MSPFPLPTKKLKEFIDWSRDRWMNNSMQQGTLKFLTDKSLPQAWLRKSRSKVSHSDLEKDLGDLAPNQFILPGILGMWSSEPLKVKVKLLSRVWLFATPWTVPYQDPPSTRILHPRDFPGKSTGVGCDFLLQGIFLTQGSNPGLLPCRQTLYSLSHWGSQRELRYRQYTKSQQYTRQSTKYCSLIT